jgi:hypothetical protein
MVVPVILEGKYTIMMNSRGAVVAHLLEQHGPRFSSF